MTKVCSNCEYWHMPYCEVEDQDTDPDHYCEEHSDNDPETVSYARDEGALIFTEQMIQSLFESPGGQLSWDDYEASIVAAGPYSFYALIAAAFTKADSLNREKLKTIFPVTYRLLLERHNNPGGLSNSELERKNEQS